MEVGEVARRPVEPVCETMLFVRLNKKGSCRALMFSIELNKKGQYTVREKGAGGGCRTGHGAGLRGAVHAAHRAQLRSAVPCGDERAQAAASDGVRRAPRPQHLPRLRTRARVRSANDSGLASVHTHELARVESRLAQRLHVLLIVVRQLN